MKTIRKEAIKQEVFDLYDQYAHSHIDRREFLQKLSLYAVGGLTVSSLMGFVMPNYDTIEVASEDPRVKSDYIEYQSPEGGGTMKALMSKPSDAQKKLGGIIVVHE